MAFDVEIETRLNRMEDGCGELQELIGKVREAIREADTLNRHEVNQDIVDRAFARARDLYISLREQIGLAFERIP